MPTVNLNRSAYVTLSGSGAGQVSLGPTSPGEVWNPSVVSVSTEQTSVVNEAQCKVYNGTPGGTTYVDGTLSGSTGDSTDAIGGQSFYPGQQVYAVWTGGDAGVTAVMNISGTRQVP